MWILFWILFVLILLLCLILWAIMPQKRRNTTPFDDTLFAHRGLHDNKGPLPENSLAAFKAAKEAGYGVEFDVRFTADRHIVVFHDDTLQRMCGVDRRVDECTYEELQQFCLLDTNEHIPLLTEVLETLDGATVLCEFKAMRSYTDVSLCAQTLPILDSYKGNYCIESFNPFMVQWFKKNAPHVIRGILSKRYQKHELKPALLRHFLSALLANTLCRPDFIAYQHTDISHPFLRLCRLFRPMMIAWTVRTPKEAKAARPFFDSYIFEGFLPAKSEK